MSTKTVHLLLLIHLRSSEDVDERSKSGSVLQMDPAGSDLVG